MHQPVNVAQFVVVEGEVGFDGDVFQKLIARLGIVLLFQVRQAQVEVHEGKLGIGRGGRLKFRQGGVVLVEIQMRFSHEEMKLRGVSPTFTSCAMALLVEIFLTGTIGRNSTSTYR